jgi:hypothetical protein
MSQLKHCLSQRIEVDITVLLFFVCVRHMQVCTFIYEVTMPIIIEMQGNFELWAQLWMLQQLWLRRYFALLIYLKLIIEV